MLAHTSLWRRRQTDVYEFKDSWVQTRHSRILVQKTNLLGKASVRRKQNSKEVREGRL